MIEAERKYEGARESKPARDRRIANEEAVALGSAYAETLKNLALSMPSPKDGNEKSLRCALFETARYGKATIAVATRDREDNWSSSCSVLNTVIALLKKHRMDFKAIPSCGNHGAGAASFCSVTVSVPAIEAAIRKKKDFMPSESAKGTQAIRKHAKAQEKSGRRHLSKLK